MADAVSTVIGTVAGLTSQLPQPFSSLSLLAEAEEADAQLTAPSLQRVRPSRTEWWVDTIRLRGSAIGRVWRAVVVVTLWAGLVAVADLVYGKDLGLTNTVTPMLSVVVGLMLVFRNGSAYQRWDAGRTTFSKMMATVRCLSRTVWINVGAPTPVKGRLNSEGVLKPHAESEDIESGKDLEDKIKALRLMVAFVVSLSRGPERRTGETDEPRDRLRRSIMSGESMEPNGQPPRFHDLARTTGFGWGAAEADHHTPPLTGAHCPPSATHGSEPVSAEIRRLSSNISLASNHNPSLGVPPLASPRSFRSAMWPGSDEEAGGAERRPLLGNGTGKGKEGEGKMRQRLRRSRSGISTDSMVILQDYLAKPSLPLPLVIAHQLGLYFASCKRRNLLESIGPAGYNNLVGSLNSLVSDFTTCERLASVGIPTVYGIHLKQCTSLFLFTLPLVLVEAMGFAMIPFFTLMGIEGIASEIEMPFGVDDSDLPLDLFCAELRNEVEHCISRLATGTEEWSM
ncbi:SPOSA6832_00803 [Sporobolomyces salmonicolor]|uniref:SPOSA6832_00803-mRNA-1:cds n=1 Tax=Sporidiobolus salmonicolor TaxID=5005 RepID=A0A0D6EH92_SPOSA|nr:SPOSA6832_00803 [Sporobolomyces salmonicolor]